MPVTVCGAPADETISALPCAFNSYLKHWLPVVCALERLVLARTGRVHSTFVRMVMVPDAVAEGGV